MQKKYTINFGIYSEKKLKQAILDFSDVGEMQLSKNILIISGDNDLEVEEIFNELMNYVIGLLNY